MNDSSAPADPRRRVLIGVASTLIVELFALIYLIYVYPGLWGDEAIGISVLAAGMLIPTLLVLDRLKTRGNRAQTTLPRSLLFCGFTAGAIGFYVTPGVGAHGAAVVLIWLLALQAVLHSIAYRCLRRAGDRLPPALDQ